MALDLLSVGLGTAQILLQVTAAWYAYRITGMLGAARFWTLVTIALILMTVRRVTALAVELGTMPALTGSINFVDRFVLPSLISVFLLLGLYDLYEKLKKNPKP